MSVDVFYSRSLVGLVDGDIACAFAFDAGAREQRLHEVIHELVTLLEEARRPPAIVLQPDSQDPALDTHLQGILGFCFDAGVAIEQAFARGCYLQDQIWRANLGRASFRNVLRAQHGGKKRKR